MLKEFKNVSVNYEGDAVIEFNRKNIKSTIVLPGKIYWFKPMENIRFLPK